MRILRLEQLSLSSNHAWMVGILGSFSLLLATTATVQAQDDDEEEDDAETIEEFTEDFDLIDGIFSLYQDPEDGSLYMEISDDQLGEEFIVYSHTENGVLSAGTFKGAYRDQRIISFEKHYNSIEVVERNTSFYFDPENELSRAADANISDAILSVVDVDAENEGTDGDDATAARYLVKADGLFLTEDLHQVKPSPNPEAPPFSFSLGGLASDRTKYDDIRNYPENLDVVVDYVYTNPAPIAFGSEAVTDARSVTIKVQHSILAMPEEGFVPRFDDYRVGYFLDRVTDLTDPSSTPYRDLINRWRLEKQDPEAEISDPVKPITWWIENTTPEEYRDTIRDATLAWNESFEKAGFSNAIEVKVQPDDADWDAGDIRYNVLRWTSSPIPPFGGYGPSFTNPRTGEILAADIMLEYIFLTNRMFFTDLFETTASASMFPSHNHDHENCEFGHMLQQNLMFASMAAMRDGLTATEQSELVDQGIYYLILHEVGHTLGLNHNMKASIMYGPKEVHDASVTNGIVAGSVMDYPSLNVAPLGMEQGDYTNTRPGPYDDWAIIFGYSPDMDDPAMRKTHLERSLERGLAFGNDADDMRAAGGWGIDPRVMIGDMSNDMIVYGRDRTELTRDLMGRLLDKFDEEGSSYQDVVSGYLVLTGQQSAMARSVSRQIGGIYVERAAQGQAGATQAFTPVPRAQQEAAMAYLADEVFAPEAFAVPADLAAKLQSQRRGFDFFGVTEDPKIHERALGIQRDILTHLTSASVLNRMTNYQIYGGEYSAAEMLLDLNEAIFGGDLTGNPNTFRQNLQVLYTGQLVAVLEMGEHSNVSRSAALGAIMDINNRLGLIAFGQSVDAKAHRAHIRALVNSVLDD